MSEPSPGGLLSDLRVLEIGHFIVAPFCTRLLAGLDADVIKIEPTGGAIYLVETAAVRATAASFVFNGARLIAWIFPIIAGTLVSSMGGLVNAAVIMSSIYVIGLIVPWFAPETAGKPLPE
jgi:CoA-transferase family III